MSARPLAICLAGTMNAMVLAYLDAVGDSFVNTATGTLSSVLDVAGAPAQTAKLVKPGDTVVIISYARMPIEEARSFRPRIVFPSEGNRLEKPHS
mgnify:CR=1 FL=1